MRVLLKRVVVFVVLSVMCSVGAQALEIMKPSPVLTGDEVSIKHAQLDQIAIVVSMVSNGSSQLRKDLGVGASPEGNVVRPIETNGKPTDLTAPFISVFPASKPVKTKLEGIGEGRIMGAVSALVPIGGLKKDDVKAPAGEYMLFMLEPSYKGVTTKYQSLLLISLNIDDKGKISYKEVARTDDENGFVDNLSKIGGFPQLSVSFGGSTPWRADVQMQWLGETHKFSFAMEVFVR